MRALSIALLAAVPFAAYGATSAVSLQHDLQDVPEESIRAALEKTLAPKYRQGVFEHGEEAIEAIHNVDPALASQVVDIAKQDNVQKAELVKRQTVNVTITTVTDSSVVSVIVSTTTIDSSQPPASPTSTTSTTSANADTPTSTTTVVATAHTEQTQSSLDVPTVISTTANNGQPTTQSTNVVITSPSVSAVVQVTSTNAQGVVVTTSSTVPAVVLSSTDAAGNVRSTTSPINTSAAAVTTMATTSAARSSASPSLRTTTDANGNVVVVTIFPGGEASEVILQTSTGPDGQRRTITSYKQVPPSATTSVPATTAQTQTGSPTLAAGMAASTAQLGSELVALVCGVIGAAALF